MAERSTSRTSKAEPRRASNELTVPELLPALDPNADPPSDPGLMIRPKADSTVLPPPAEPLVEASLKSLIRMVRRA